MTDNFTHEYVTATHIAAALMVQPCTIARWCKDPFDPLPNIPVQWGVKKHIYAIRPGDVVNWLSRNRTRMIDKHFTDKQREHIKKWLKQQKAESNG